MSHEQLKVHFNRTLQEAIAVCNYVKPGAHASLPALSATARRRRRAIRRVGGQGCTHSQLFALASHYKSAAIMLLALLLFHPAAAQAQRRRKQPSGSRAAIVVDERLSALRDAPGLSANLLQRLGRGRIVLVEGEQSSREGVTFLRVALTSRTGGWLQSDAVVRPSRAGEDARLLRLIRGSEEFDLLSRARIFLDAFPRSALRPAVLLLFGDAAGQAAERLTREAQRRLDEREMEAGGAQRQSYFLNFNGLDRYRRQGVVYSFDAASKQYHYDGAAWREILRRYPRSPEALGARERLDLSSRAPR
ncbi:MAG: hypothetical protein QOE46_2912 [Acidobacteriota bacterium]|nr:hypothetical protein [Acidobacteriota bacterium]